MRFPVVPSVCQPNRLHRAGLGTSCLLASLDPLETKRTLPDPRVRAVVLELGHVERARDHAVATPKALLIVPGDRAFRMLSKRPYQASRLACRLKAVHTLLLSKDLPFLGLVAVDHGKGIGRGRPDPLKDGLIPEPLWLFKAVGLGTGKLARATSNAPRRVDQKPVAIVFGSSLAPRALPFPPGPRIPLAAASPVSFRKSRLRMSMPALLI